MTQLPLVSLRIAAALAFLALPTLSASAAQVAPVASDSIAEAIALAVADRMGSDARVSVVMPRQQPRATRVDGKMVASPEPGARTGAPARFTLLADGVRIGSAVATVHVTAGHVRATRALPRNHTLIAEDVEAVDGLLADQPLRRVPGRGDVVGARVRRDVAKGEAITATVIDLPMAIKSGDVVSAVVRVGSIEAEGRAVASGSGSIGDVIRVVPPGTRRPLKARITGAGKVEIIQ
jgi:flagella basal body P-ring formation protein FlgA